MKTPTLITLAVSTLIAHAQPAKYQNAIPKLESTIQEEMAEWNIAGVSVALVDDQEIVYSKGFGEAKRDSIFRAGSISKLFNALAVMQQVDAGNLDLDAPIPSARLPINPFSDNPSVTLRHILSHRSGLQREAPIGSYLDDSQPGISATVESIRSGVLVTVPGEKTRYSNVAPTLAGHLVEQATGKSFEDYQKERLLTPLGMADSSWTIDSTPGERIITSYMRVADGRGGWTRRETPLFDLGTIPAGNLFTTADDLAKFASALVKGGGVLVKPDSLKTMWTPQFTDSENGFGLGFMMGKFNGRRTVGHSGAVYGHSTSFVVLPEEKLAVIILINEDICNGPVNHIHRVALSLLLNAKFGDELPSEPVPHKVENLQQFEGDYESQSYWANLEVIDGELSGNISGQPTQFHAIGDLTFKADSRINDAANVTFRKNEAGLIIGFNMGGQRYQRVSEKRDSLPEEWRSVLGSYGLDFIPVVISERHGHLYAMTENMVDYRLTPVNRNVCALPPGMYVNEEVVFLPNRKGRIHSINYANMVFHRRN